ncbi:hypothetical protein fHeYen902_232 [Yersinia phage fHe-Yen9-02]|nr:hypothetical protein fHeYen902_232 [Yersinia phage fHe-Yen9-02]
MRYLLILILDCNKTLRAKKGPHSYRDKFGNN